MIRPEFRSRAHKQEFRLIAKALVDEWSDTITTIRLPYSWADPNYPNGHNDEDEANKLEWFKNTAVHYNTRDTASISIVSKTVNINYVVQLVTP